MDDLISRKAAMESIKDPVVRGFTLYALKSVPSVPAVPLDKLCEWLEVHARTPIYNMQHTAEWWNEELKMWMEEQDAAD